MGSSRILGNKSKTATAPLPKQIYRDDPPRDDGESVSAMSLHSNVGQFDDQIEADLGEELPPYTDSATNDVNTENTAQVYEESFARASEFGLDTVDVKHTRNLDKKGARDFYLSNKHTTDPVALEWAIRHQVHHAPTSYLCIHGEHTEKRYDSQKKKTEDHTVVDFDVKVDLTSGHCPPKEWTRSGKGATVTTIDNQVKTYRGGVLKSTHKVNRQKKQIAHIEQQEDQDNDHQASLTEWCHLFCASHYSLKSFEVRHEIIDRDDAFIKQRVLDYVRATNYRGRVTVDFQLCPRTQTFQTKHKLNIARHNNWIWWICVLLQLWIITWPILFFTTKRWAVVKITWPFKRRVPMPATHPDSQADRQMVVYAAMSEKEFIESWRYTIQQSCLNRTQDGQVLSWAGHGEEEARANAEREAEVASRRDSEASGGFIGGVLGLARGLSNIARERNDARGWGYDE